MCDRINGKKNVSSAGCSELGAEMIEKRGYDVVAEAMCFTIRPSNEWSCRHGIIAQADNGLQKRPRCFMTVVLVEVVDK